MLPIARLKNGLEISIQASHMHECTPKDDAGPWSSVEVGYPNKVIEELIPYAEDPKTPTKTTYNNVPAYLIKKIIDESGGLEFGLIPMLLIDEKVHFYWANPIITK